MAIYRLRDGVQFTMVANEMLRDSDLSLKAKGLLAVMQSLPEDWVFSIGGLAKICKEGGNAIRAALSELKEYGYVKVTKLPPNKTASGKFEYTYDIYPISTANQSRKVP